MLIFNSKDIIDDFNATRFSTESVKIYDSLVRLRPDKLNTNKLIELVKYIEKNSYHHSLNTKHYNIFGTGGDRLKTINLSTIASIVASNFVNIYKVGTGAVTSNWGSAEFVHALAPSFLIVTVTVCVVPCAI